ncbi:MAG: YndJ family transporter [Acidobacteria bacterium]|nr:YndJ family transporter [Acidobacteriota bacterium]
MRALFHLSSLALFCAMLMPNPILRFVCSVPILLAGGLVVLRHWPKRVFSYLQLAIALLGVVALLKGLLLQTFLGFSEPWLTLACVHSLHAGVLFPHYLNLLEKAHKTGQWHSYLSLAAFFCVAWGHIHHRLYEWLGAVIYCFLAIALLRLSWNLKNGQSRILLRIAAIVFSLAIGLGLLFSFNRAFGLFEQIHVNTLLVTHGWMQSALFCGIHSWIWSKDLQGEA